MLTCAAQRSVIDGTGAPRRGGDVGIRDGRVVAIGDVDEPATRTIDVDGAIVAPGFVDVHTHYDAQVLWDPTLSPSILHGVTTAIAGNCGFSVAPLTPEGAPYLLSMLARVEGMHLAALEAASDWSWNTTAELDRSPARCPPTSVHGRSQRDPASSHRPAAKGARPPTPSHRDDRACATACRRQPRLLLSMRKPQRRPGDPVPRGVAPGLLGWPGCAASTKALPGIVPGAGGAFPSRSSGSSSTSRRAVGRSTGTAQRNMRTATRSVRTVSAARAAGGGRLFADAIHVG
jgi:hypothetical protein